MLTPYQYGSNNPVRNIDLDGLEGVVFQDVWNGKASVVDWINNPNAWKAGLDNISSVNPFWLGYVRSYEVITGKDYNTGEAKSRVSSAIEGTGDVMFSLTLGKFLKLPKASTSLEMQMSQTAKATGQPLATPAQQAVKTIEEKDLSKLSTPVQQAANEGLRFGKNAKGHLIKHADVLGFGNYSPQQLQKIVPELENAANNLFGKMKLERVGQWSEFQDAKFYIGEGKMMITQQDGTFITTINKTSNAWFQKATPIK